MTIDQNSFLLFGIFVHIYNPSWFINRSFKILGTLIIYQKQLFSFPPSLHIFITHQYCKLVAFKYQVIWLLINIYIYLTSYLCTYILPINLVWLSVKQSLRIFSAMTFYQKYLSPSLFIFLTRQFFSLEKLGAMTINQSNLF